MSDVFISYSRKDIAFARLLHAALKQNDLETWIDWQDIPPGSDWLKEVYAAIEQADVFVFLISNSSIISEVCQLEIAQAASNNKRLIPVVIDEVDVKGIPPELAALNWIFFRDFEKADAFTAAFQTLIKAIQIDQVWVKEHTRLQNHALEWERLGYDKSRLLRGRDLEQAERWLSSASGKEPIPTALHSRYLLASRQESSRRQGLTLGIVMAGLVLAILMGLIAWTQRNLAVSAEYSRATAQAQAEEKSQIALSRQLAAQAELISGNGKSREIIAVLLANESMQISPSLEAAQILQNNTLLRLTTRITVPLRVRQAIFSPDGRFVALSSTREGNAIWVYEVATGKEIAHMTHGAEVRSIVFSSDSRYVISGGCDQEDALSFCQSGTSQVWEIATGKEIARMTHDNVVTSAAISPDGRYVVSGSFDKTARVWEAATGKEIARMTHVGPVIYVAFSPDGRTVISGSTDGTILVWEAISGKETARMTHVTSLMIMALSPNGRYMVSGTLGLVQVWEIPSGKEISRMEVMSWVNSVAFSPDSQFVVSGSNDNTARVWEAITGKEIARMTFASPVSKVAFSPDGRYVISGSEDGTARLWEAVSGKEIARMIHNDEVSSVAFSPDGNYFVSGSWDKTACVWEVNTRNEIARMTHDDGVTAVAVSPDNRFVASVSKDAIDRLWELTTGKEVANWISDEGAITFSQDSRLVVSGGLNATIREWETATGKEIWQMYHYGQLTSVAFSPDGKYLVAGNNILNIAQVLDAATGKEISHITHDSSVISVAFSPDGHYVVSGDLDGGVRVWEAASGREITRMTLESILNSVAFSPDGQYVVSVGGMNVRVWNASSGKELIQVTYRAGADAVAFSPDGQYVISGGCDQMDRNSLCHSGSARVWEAASGKEITRMTHDDVVTSVAFSPDGRYAASGSADKTARVWEISTGKEIARMTYKDSVTSIAFSPDGHYLVAGSLDNTVRVWLWRSKDLIDEACSRLPRNLTLVEWQQYISDALPYQAVCRNLPLGPEPTPASKP